MSILNLFRKKKRKPNLNMKPKPLGKSKKNKPEEESEELHVSRQVNRRVGRENVNSQQLNRQRPNIRKNNDLKKKSRTPTDRPQIKKLPNKRTPKDSNRPNLEKNPTKTNLRNNKIVEREITLPTTATTSNKNVKRVFTYAKPIKIKNRTEPVKEVEVELITDRRLIAKRPILETITDLSEVSLTGKISLVNYFRQKESGKLDERSAREEYRRNTAILQKETALLYFFRESAKRNLEHNEVLGYRGIDIRIDPMYSLEDIIKCAQSKLLASYNIEIVHNNDILSKMGVDPIIVKMTLKKI